MTARNASRVLLAVLCTITSNCFSQTTSISGIINIYTSVTTVLSNNVTVGASTGFSAGDRVLLIQMKGATIDNTSNTAAFGTITNYNDAGNYEFATIASVAGNTITFTSNLLRTYTISGLVQLIRVPQYVNATVTAVLTCQPWNGTTGGVLVFEACGTVTLNANIDVSGMGFRGGIRSVQGGTCLGAMDYYYTMASGLGGQKGEGITTYATTYEAGRGALANGGGGGNALNAGGAGGGNYALGGRGGDQALGCSQKPVGGEGGAALTYSNAVNKIFLGGGGGGGHQNETNGTVGTNGGGIVIIKANIIVGNSNNITSNGIDNTLNTWADGAGGAGGTILLDIINYNLPLNIQANGGKGGNANWNNITIGCHGTGGGGGGGIAWINGATLPATSSFNGGLPGTYIGPSGGGCGNSSYGADTGSVGGILTGLILQGSIVSSYINPVLTVTPDIAVCLGDSTTLIVNGANTYFWSPYIGLNSITEDTVTANPSATTTYTIIGASGCGRDTTSVTVAVDPIPAVSVVPAAPTTLCSGSSITLTATGAATYAWSPATGISTTTGSVVTAHPPATITYTITGTNVTGCIGEQTVTIPVVAGPTVTATASPYNITSGENTTLTASGGGPYQWYPSVGLSDPDISNPVASPVQTTTYCVTVTDTITGCSDSDCITINVDNLCGTLFIPNVFSPNGDGENDTLKVYIEKNCMRDFHLVIFDRWGEKVFESYDQRTGWDGTYREELLDTAVFVYYLRATLATEEKINQKGNISLLR